MEAEFSVEVSGKVNSIPVGKLIVEALTLNSRFAAQSPRSSLCSLWLHGFIRVPPGSRYDDGYNDNMVDLS